MAPLLIAKLAGQGLTLLLAAQLALTLLPTDGWHGAQWQLLCAALVLLLAQLLGALAQQRELPGRSALGQGLLAVLALLVLLTLAEPAALLTAATWLLCAGLFIVCLLGSLLRQLLVLRFNTSPNLAATIITVGLLILLLAPVWLGPWASFSGSQESISTLALMISPLTLLAALADIDYLRSDWFYQYSAIASLPFSYPSPVLLLALYGGLIVGTRRGCQQALEPQTVCERRQEHVAD